ncbi:MAG: tetratricopeptide repeat protein, partial [Cyanobacteria bacterium P01_E01_bin.48]
EAASQGHEFTRDIGCLIKLADYAAKRSRKLYEAIFAYALFFQTVDRHQLAINYYDKILEFKPDTHQAWYNRGNALSALQRYEEAIGSYDRALEVKPDYHKAWYSKSLAYARLECIDVALENLARAVHIEPKVIELAKSNTDFERMRSHPRFQALIYGKPDSQSDDD